MFHKYKDFRYLLKLEKNISLENLPKVKKYQLAKLQESYFKILYSIKKHDLKILIYYRNWKLESLHINTSEVKNKQRKLKGLALLQISYYKSEKLLHKYLDSFGTDFEVIFTEFSIRKDWKTHFIKLFPKHKIPEFIQDLAEKLQGYYHYSEYVNHAINITDLLPYQELLITPYFFNEFTAKKEMITNKLSDFAKHLKNNFREIGIPDLFFKASFELFDLSNLKAKPSEDTDFWEEVTAVKSELKHDFDIWQKPLSEYLAKIERIKAKRGFEEKYNKRVKQS